MFSLKMTLVLATLASVLSFGYFLGQDLIATYPDGMSHLMIAKRTCASLTPNPQQLGNVWLPLPHILLMPLVCPNDYLYQNGIAGSLLSMFSYLLAVVFIYKTVYTLTENTKAAFVGAFVFGANLNVLYMQSIPMTELVLFATIAGSLYYLVRWNQSQNDIHLFLSSVAMGLSVWTRYEAWIFFLGFIGSLVLSSIKYRFSFVKAVATLLFWSVIPGFLIVLWFLWNAVYFLPHDPLGFTRGEYAAPSNWVSISEPVIGNLDIAFQTYFLATLHNIGLPILILGCLAGIYFVVDTKLRPTALVAFVPLAIFPFFVFMLYTGQRPLHIEEVTGDLYNSRFALQMIIPTAILIGYMAKVRGITYVVLTMVIVGSLMGSTKVITLDEAVVFQQDRKTIAQDREGYWIAEHYDDGRILMEVYGNEIPLFRLGPAISNIVWEGTYLLWDEALADPDKVEVKWVFMRKGNGGFTADKVWKVFQEHPDRLKDYQLVHKSDLVEIYKRKE